MKNKELETELEGFKLVKHKIGWEGFDYCFRWYSDFTRDVKDKKFHELREGYLDGKITSFELIKYINTKIDELSNAIKQNEK